MKPIQSAPAVLVEIDGAAIDPADSGALGHVLVQQRLSLPSMCELRFFDPQGALGSGDRMLVGAKLRVAIAGEIQALFHGEVTAVDRVYGPPHGRELRVRGYDALHRLRKRQPVRAHVQVNLMSLARDLTADLDVIVDGIDAGPHWPKLIQHRQTDLEILREAAERSGLYFTLRENVLYLLTLEGMEPPIPLRVGDTLLEASVELNGDPACRSVSTTGWDPSTMEIREAHVADARVGRIVSAAVPPQRMGGSGELSFVGLAVLDDLQAAAHSQAELDRRVAREVVLRGLAEGNCRLRPGAVVDVRGVTGSLEGSYVLTSVTHTCDTQHGFVSEIDTSPPPAPAPRNSPIVTIGVVSRIDDPAGMGRIQVSLPTYGELESEWMSVVASGAGAGKGFMILPDVGDHVLVVFAQEDPVHGVVIGGLYGPHAPKDVGLEDASVRRWTLLTPGGQSVRLDDHLGAIRIENSDGSRLDLGSDQVRLHSQRDLEIAAPGKHIFIRAAKVDFERA